MIKIGITGGIGSGKSVICKTFSLLGIPIYYSDYRAKELLNSSQEIKKALTNLFGSELYTKNGINKTKLADIIFNDKNSLEKVNSIVHPVVMKDFFSWCKNQKSSIVINESAIIFEANLKHHFDYIIAVTAPEEIRINRVIKRDNAKREDVISRINHQYPDHKKTKESDFVIINDGEKAILPQISKILKSL
jgi:dephospho-CoA kinase